jgi:hypothetical protein
MVRAVVTVYDKSNKTCHGISYRADKKTATIITSATKTHNLSDRCTTGKECLLWLEGVKQRLAQ